MGRSQGHAKVFVNPKDRFLSYNVSFTFTQKSKVMKLAVVGSRSFCNEVLLEKTLESYKGKIKVVVSGGAKGADAMAESWAKKNSVETLVFKPDWQKYGKGAGPVRNRDIIANCDHCVAFWDGKSKGTKSSIDLCKKLNKTITVVYYEHS